MYCFILHFQIPYIHFPEFVCNFKPVWYGVLCWNATHIWCATLKHKHFMCNCARIFWLCDCNCWVWFPHSTFIHSSIQTNHSQNPNLKIANNKPKQRECLDVPLCHNPNIVPRWSMGWYSRLRCPMNMHHPHSDTNSSDGHGSRLKKTRPTNQVFE